MTDAERLFSKIFMTIAHRFGEVKSFRHVVRLGMPAIKGVIESDYSALAQDLYQGESFDRFFLDKPGALKIFGPPEAFSSAMSGKQMEAFAAVIDSASLIFAHSILDGVAYDCCKVTVLVSPASWEKQVERKQVSLSDLKDREYSDTLKDQVTKYLDKLERESLLAKIEKLLEVCQPPSHFDPMRDYAFSKERIQALDTLRHNMVHGGGVPKGLPNGDADIRYLEQTGGFLISLIHEKFGLQVDPQTAFQSIGRQA